jgi:hypothetical protein
MVVDESQARIALYGIPKKKFRFDRSFKLSELLASIYANTHLALSTPIRPIVSSLVSSR